MTPIMQASGISDFSWDNRLKGLDHVSTKVIAAFCKKDLIGYIEFCRDWYDENNIYLSSIQILPKHQGTNVFKRLVQESYVELKNMRYNLLKSNVQKANLRMINIFKKIDFEVIDENGRKTMTVVGNPADIYRNRLFRKLLKSK